jgi:opacity protein-like surface antigen
MKTILYLVPLGVLFGVSLQAQNEASKVDLFFGYSFLRYNSAQTIPAFTANGGIGTFAWNFNNHIAMEAELGGYHNGNVNGYQFDSTSFTYLFGPRVSLGRNRRFDPYLHILFGGQNFGTSIAQSSVLVVNPLGSTTLSNGRYQTSQNSFAMAVGGGLDIRLSRTFTLRPLQVDYYMTNFSAPDVTEPLGSTVATARTQHDFRYATGIAFNFGGGH